MKNLDHYLTTPSGRYLSKLMQEHYTVDNLVNVDQDEFERVVLNYADHWGHDHNFGSFKMDGTMGQRHIMIMAAFMEEFGVRRDDFDGATVLDIGCWSGGMSLLACAMGANVQAIDLNSQAVLITDYLSKSFGLSRRLMAKTRSLYMLEPPGDYDIVIFSGVLYHVKNMIRALQVVREQLKDNGIALIETSAIDHSEPMCLYKGPRKTNSTWFVPSQSAVIEMCKDAGLHVEKTIFTGNRVLARCSCEN